TTPQDIKELAIIMPARRLMGAAFLKSRILKLDDTTIGDITEFTTLQNKIIKKYRNHTILVS
ncbi:MAG: hypothetical protein QQN41_07475, partial [Nitrosopumilus sp.]